MKTHPDTGYQIDPVAGVVFGRTGLPIGASDRKGYLHIGYRCDGAQRGLLAHRMIWEAVNGPLTPGMTINHKNGIKNDNRIDNLEAVTQKENIRHAINFGLTPIGDKHPSARLKSDDVLSIRRRKAAGETSRELASAYGVSYRHIDQITSGRRWAHLQEDEAEAA